MDLFRALTRGASLPKPAKGSVDKSDKQKNLEREVEQEVDFFHKQEKLPTEDEDEEEEQHNQLQVAPPIIQTEEDARILRESYNCNVNSEDAPLPIGSFQDLVSRFNLNKTLLKNLADGGFVEPTPIQCEAIPATMMGKDVIGCAPTGSGKTLAFLIPMVQLLTQKKGKKNGTRGLIISPTKELAYQIFVQLSQLAKDIPELKVGYLNKSLAGKLRNKVISSAKFDILVSTPLRLIDLVEAERLDLSHVEDLVIDEADKLFESNFLEQTDRVLAACTNTKLRRSLFSATITSSVEELGNSIMVYPERIIIGKAQAANTNIEQKLVFCGNEHGKLVAIRDLIQQGEFKPPVIIFLQSIQRAKALFHELLYDGLNVDVIHAERTQQQREAILERFRKGELWCLICTDVLSRGIDFKGINLVINYDVPNSTQAYVHRVGRTGRAGRAGRAITFYTRPDIDAVKIVINAMKQSGSVEGVPEWMREGLPKLTLDQRRKLKKGVIDRKRISTAYRKTKKQRRSKEV